MSGRLSPGIPAASRRLKRAGTALPYYFLWALRSAPFGRGRGFRFGHFGEYRLQLGQNSPKAFGKILNVMNGTGKRYRIDAPALSIRGNDFLQSCGSNFPRNARPGSIRCDNESISMCAAEWILECGHRAKTPAIGQSLFNDRETVVHGTSRRPVHSWMLFSRGAGLLVNEHVKESAAVVHRPPTRLRIWICPRNPFASKYSIEQPHPLHSLSRALSCPFAGRN